MRLLWLIPVLLIAAITVAQAQPPAPEPLYSPLDVTVMAAKDLATVAEEDRPYTRYLPLANLTTAKERREYWGMISLVVNSLSREKKIIRASPLPDADNPLLARLDIRYYTWKAKFFDNLVEKGSGPTARFEPYFRANLEVRADVYVTKTREVEKIWPGGKDLEGKEFPAGYRYTETEKYRELVDSKRSVKLDAAPWIAGDPPIWIGIDGKKKPAIGFLQDWCQTQNPIARGDWFINFATLAPRYYEFLALGNKEADFQKLVFDDVEIVKKAKTKTRGAVVKSRVAHHNRILERRPTLGKVFGGAYWRSTDFLKSTDADDLFANPLLDEGDAYEIIANLLNGLHAYSVFDKNDVRQDKANEEIATDFLTKVRPDTIRVALNCMACHAAENGIRYVNDAVRRLSSKQLKLLIPDEKKFKQVDELFSDDLGPIADFDKLVYSAPVSAASGMQPAELSKALYAAQYRYVAEPLDLAAISHEVGEDPKYLDDLLHHAVNLDPRLVGLTQIPPEPIRRDQWESGGFPSMMLLIMEAKSKAKKK